MSGEDEEGSEIASHNSELEVHQEASLCGFLSYTLAIDESLRSRLVQVKAFGNSIISLLSLFGLIFCAIALAKINDYKELVDMSDYQSLLGVFLFMILFQNFLSVVSILLDMRHFKENKRIKRRDAFSFRKIHWLVFLSGLTGFILSCILLSKDIQSDVKKDLMENIPRYKTIGKFKNAMDKIQQEDKCCGITGRKNWWLSKDWFDFKNIPIQTNISKVNIKIVPFSCCMREKVNKPCDFMNAEISDTIYRTGCLNKIVKYCKKLFKDSGWLMWTISVLQLIIAFISRIAYFSVKYLVHDPTETLTIEIFTGIIVSREGDDETDTSHRKSQTTESREETNDCNDDGDNDDDEDTTTRSRKYGKRITKIKYKRSRSKYTNHLNNYYYESLVNETSDNLTNNNMSKNVTKIDKTDPRKLLLGRRANKERIIQIEDSFSTPQKDNEIDHNSLFGESYLVPKGRKQSGHTIVEMITD